MLTGSMAMMEYSVYRFTADVNVVLEPREEDAKRIIETFEPDYYVPHNSVSRAISSKRMFNVIHRETAFKIDCVVKKNDGLSKNRFRESAKNRFLRRGYSDNYQRRFNHLETIMGERQSFRKINERCQKFDTVGN